MTAFIFEDEYTFEWPVTVLRPMGGDFVEQSFVGRFRQIPDEELFGPNNALSDNPGMDQVVEEKIHRLKKVFLGWMSGVEDDQGNPVECTPDGIDALLRLRNGRRAVQAAYMAALNPKDGIRAGN